MFGMLWNKGETHGCPVVFPENILVDVTKELLLKLKNNLDGRQERNRCCDKYER